MRNRDTAIELFALTGMPVPQHFPRLESLPLGSQLRCHLLSKAFPDRPRLKQPPLVSLLPIPCLIFPETSCCLQLRCMFATRLTLPPSWAMNFTMPRALSAVLGAEPGAPGIADDPQTLHLLT